MLEFTADISGLDDLSDRKVEQYISDSMDAIADAAREEWVRLAKDSDLGVTKDAYIRAIGPIESPSPTERNIELKGWLPNALESGVSSFDMKPGLLKGQKSVVIPMLYGKLGQNKVQPLPKQTYDRVKNMKRGERFSTKLGKSKYEGLQKARKEDGRATYVKFRTVSENSPEESWIHPGLSGLKLEEQVQQFIEQHMDSILAPVRERNL